MAIMQSVVWMGKLFNLINGDKFNKDIVLNANAIEEKDDSFVITSLKFGIRQCCIYKKSKLTKEQIEFIRNAKKSVSSFVSL